MTGRRCTNPTHRIRQPPKSIATAYRRYPVLQLSLLVKSNYNLQELSITGRNTAMNKRNWIAVGAAIAFVSVCMAVAVYLGNQQRQAARKAFNDKWDAYVAEREAAGEPMTFAAIERHLPPQPANHAGMPGLRPSMAPCSTSLSILQETPTRHCKFTPPDPSAPSDRVRFLHQTRQRSCRRC